MALPPDLELTNLLRLPVPGDLTLLECKRFFATSETARSLRALSSRHAARLRFVADTDPPEDLPDHLTIAQFRDLVSQGRGRVIIDDEGGGVPAPAPELV